MKTVIALLTFASASIAEKLLCPKRDFPVSEQKRPSELTDEIRRYDTEDLILS
jgi:hypothetical protein